MLPGRPSARGPNLAQIFILWVIIYWTIRYLETTIAGAFIRGIGFFALLAVLAAMVVFDAVGWSTLSTIFRFFIIFAAISMVIIFQPELRHGLSRLSRSPMGRILRRLHLDEAPQAINILRGDLSFVGPRPERPEFVMQLEREIPFYRARHAVRPGITGWAQVNYDYGASVEDALTKLQYDLYYIKHQSLWLDLLILAKTLGLVLTMRGR